MSPESTPEEQAALRRAALRLMRERRASYVAAQPFPYDTLHILSRCPRCDAQAIDAIGVGEPAAAASATTPCSMLRDVVAMLTSAFADEVTLPREPCRCGAAGTTLRAGLARYYRAAFGEGVDLVVDAERVGDGAPRFRFARAPRDGVEHFYAEGDAAAAEGLDALTVRTFGRPIFMAAVWRVLFDSANGAIVPVGAGHWLFAGVRSAPELGAALRDLVGAGDGPRALVQLDGDTIADPTWAWLRDRLADPRHVEWVAGSIVDRDIVRDVLGVVARRHGLEFADGAAPRTVIVQRRGLPSLIEIDTVVVEGQRNRLSIEGAAAAAVGAATAHLEVVQGFVDALREVRPDVQYQLDGILAYPVRADGHRGNPFHLQYDPYRGYADRTELARDLRFRLGEHAPFASRARLCACGAPVTVQARLVPHALVDELIRTRSSPPVVLRMFEVGDERRAAAVATLECDRHTDFVLESERHALGLAGDALDERVAFDERHAEYTVRAAEHRDEQGRKAVMLQGPGAASIALSTALTRGALESLEIGPPGPDVHAAIPTADALILSDPGFDPGLRARLVDVAILLLRNAVARAESRLDLALDLTVTAPRRGVFVRAEDPV